MSQVTFQVPDMHCGACEASIRKALSADAGVRSIAVDLDAKRVAVDFDPGATSADAVKARIEKAGFDVA